MNPISWVQGLQGLALIAVICGFLFFEEVGVPIPFAPGDIVLALGGIAIAGGRVNGAALVGALAVTIVIGAMLGRELTALLGWERLMRIAGPLHARRPLERAAALLQRGGWRAIFTARLIPGMRVYTTQVVGVSQISRSTFLGGLLPATAVYLAGFVGLGAAIGRPVLGLIRDAEHQVLLGIALVLALILLILLTRAPLRRGLASLQAAGWTGPLRFSLDSVGLTLILGSLGMNFAGHAIAEALNLPLFLDSIGTLVAGVIAGPWVGGSVGFVSNLIAGNTVDPIAAPYAIVSFMVGFAAGLSRYLNWQRRASGWVSLWLVCAVLAALVSTPLNFLMSSGRSGVALGDSIFAALNGAHVPRVLAAFIGEISIDLPDKLISVVAALLIAQSFGEQGVTAARRAELDLREAFTFVFRSRRWLRRLLFAALCLLFSWLVIPYLLLAGYVLEITRTVRGGGRELPAWDHRWRKSWNGFKLTCVLLLWLLPGILLAIPAGVVSSLQEQPGSVIPASVSAITGIVAGFGSVWLILVLLLEPPIISEYLEHGFLGALNPWAVVQRARVNVGLSIVVGALVVVLTTIGVIGLAGLLIGVLLTLPYASFVAAYLVGIYARQTDRRLTTAPGSPTLRPRPDLVAETQAP